MAGSISPVDTGLVTSLARQGDNLTGMTISFDFDMDSKRLQLLREAVPNISRVGVIQDSHHAGEFGSAVLGRIQGLDRPGAIAARDIDSPAR
jgi:ABC-type uncharacterized transport system substrate-binding protein